MNILRGLLIHSDKICRPDPIIYKDETKYKALYSSNQAAYIILVICTVIELPLVAFIAPEDYTIRFTVAVAAYWLVFLSCCRKG